MKKISRFSQSGFTVTEMVVVIAIISILTVIALMTFSSVKNKAKLAVVKNNINTIDNALQKFAQKHQGHFPGLTRWPVRYGTLGIVKGNRIVGGNAGPKGSDGVMSAAIVNQDDYLDDTKADRSPFRDVLPSRFSNFPKPMRAIDALYDEHLLVPYPDNPLRPPGTGMVNVAYTLGSFQKNINTFSLLPITGITSPDPIGLAPGRPIPAPGTNPPSIRPYIYKYSIYAYMWDYYTANPTNKNNYPFGDFAYIPLGLSDPSGEYATDYWLIGYGDQGTLMNSAYNQLLDNLNFPNLPPPMGDGDPSTPPAAGTYEYMVRQFVKGALVIKATKYENQLSIDQR